MKRKPGIPRLYSEVPQKGKRYFWETILGKRFEGVFVEMDNGTAIMKMDDGKLRGV